MISSLQNSGPYLLVAPRGCDVFKPPRGSSEPDPVGKDETAPHLTPMSPITWKQNGNSAPVAPLINLFFSQSLAGKATIAPLRAPAKSFRINKRCKTRAPRKLNESNQLQNRAPAKSFRIISFQKNNVFALGFHQTPSNSQIEATKPCLRRNQLRPCASITFHAALS